jgi:glycosyltransferase involved in cell wall biosynthesis
LVTAGEPLPTDRADIRLHRTGLLARYLASRGHRVQWVTNRFDHFRKVQRTLRGTRPLTPGLDLTLLESRGYKRNVSVQRMRDHADLGLAFRAESAAFDRPDVVLAAMPTIELAEEAVAYAARIGAPSIVDIRDLWPDLFVERAPRGAQWLAHLVLTPLHRALRRALGGATAIIAQNEGFVRWGLARAGRPRGVHDVVLRLGYERAPITPDLRAEARVYWSQAGVVLDGSRGMMVFAGSVSSQFDFAPVVEAADALAVDGVQTVVCGVGESRDALVAAARSRPHLLVPGWCSQTQLRVLLEHATVGLLPYAPSLNFTDAMPNKVGEYLAHGLALAGSLSAGEMADVISRHDLGFTYGGQGAPLTAGVQDLLRDPARREGIRARATARFAAEFDADVVHAALERLLTSIVAATPLRERL